MTGLRRFVTATLMAAAAASADAQQPSARPETLIDRLPDSIDQLAISGEPALRALNKALESAPAERKAILYLALAVVHNQQGDARAARAALASIPAGADRAIAARALYESALALEQAGDAGFRALYEKAAAGDVPAVAARARLRLATLDRFAGKTEAARRSLEAAAKFEGVRAAAEDGLAALDRFVEQSRTARLGNVPGGHWRPRIADTFAAPRISFPTYDQFFRNGWMQIYSRETGFNRFSLGMFSGGGVVTAEHMVAEFTVKLRQVVEPNGRWLTGFVVRGDPGKRSGVVVQCSDSRTLRIETPAGSETFEPPVYRPRGPNRFRVVALHARVEIHVNGLPAAAVLDPEFRAGRFELLAAGCVCDYDDYSLLVPSGRPVDLARFAALNSAALDAAGNGDFADALARLDELLPLTEIDCESRLYRLRLLREHGSAEHLRQLAAAGLEQFAPDHWIAVEQARFSLGMKWADEPLRPLFARASQAFGRGRTAESIRILSEILVKSPDNIVALDARAEARRVAGEPEKSAADCEAVIKLDKRCLMPLLRLVTIARAAGKPADEVRAIERLLKAFPAFPGGAEMLEDAKKRANPGGVPAQLTRAAAPG